MESHQNNQHIDFFPKALPWWGYLLIAGIAIGSAFVFQHANPELFPLRCTLPAFLVYFGIFWLLLRVASKFLLRFNLPFTNNHALAQLAVMLVLIFLGLLAGLVASVVWWGGGGYEMRTLGQALLIGGCLGALAVLALAAGG